MAPELEADQAQQVGKVVSFAQRSLRESFVDGLPMGCNMPWYLPQRASVGAPVGARCYRGRRTLTLDFETTNLDRGDPLTASNRIVYTVTKRDDQPPRLRTLEQLEEDLRWAEVLVAQNAKFELGWLMREGLPWEHLLVWDTMIAEKVKLGNNPKRLGLGLDALCKRYGLPSKDRLIDALMVGGVCPADQPEHLLQDRCLRDVETTYRIYRRQRRELGLRKCNVVFTRCILTPVLADIERAGMYLDPDRVAREYHSVTKRFAEVERELSELASGRNLGSPLQRAEVLYDVLKFPAPKRYGRPVLTPRGWRPTDKATLKSLKPKTKKQATFIALQQERNQLKAALDKSLKFFMSCVQEHGGHFFGQFHQTRTQTHRLSSTSRKVWSNLFKQELGAQLQNLPREYKKLFYSPHPDYLVVEPDGAQLEFRVAGHLGDDEQVKKDLAEDADIHRFTASVLFEKPEVAVVSAERTAAKSDTFKPLYGGMRGSPQQEAYYAAFRQKYNGVYREQMRWVAEVLKTQQLDTAWGMTFYFPGARMDSKGYCSDTPNIFNYPVQCLATAEIIPISLTYLYWRGRLEGCRAKLINTVHDSAVALVHRGDIERYRELCQLAFFDDTYFYLESVYDMKMRVPLGLGFKAGAHWGEGQETKYQRAAA